MNWIKGTPKIPKGKRELFVVTILTDTGKRIVSTAYYMNAHIMPCNDEYPPSDCAIPHNPDEDGYCEEYKWTGWSFGNCTYCDCEWMESINVIAHMPLPQAYGGGQY